MYVGIIKKPRTAGITMLTILAVLFLNMIFVPALIENNIVNIIHIIIIPVNN
jgi:hypothetical protein